jgi:hypothetical protein
MIAEVADTAAISVEITTIQTQTLVQVIFFSEMGGLYT